MNSSKLGHFSILNMSKSELLLIKDDQSQIEFEVSSIPNWEFPHQCEFTASIHESAIQNDGVKGDESIELALYPRKLGEFGATGEDSDDDDGFRTPTSLNHQIPVIKICPPAPKKPKQHCSRTRKLSPRIRRNLQIDLSREIESMFPLRLVHEELGLEIKKARRGARKKQSKIVKISCV